LKQTRSKNECMGSCKRESVFESPKKCRVPWMRECRESRRESSKKAGLDNVTSVSGKKSKIWRAVDNLAVLDATIQRIESFMGVAKV
jgi:hypothetical protein